MFRNFSLFKTPFLGQSSVPPSFVSFFVFYIFSYLLLKTMGCFSGCLMSSAGIQKLFCGIYSAFKCSFDEFVGEKVVSLSYSSAILAPSPRFSPNFAIYIWVYNLLCINFVKSMCLDFFFFFCMLCPVFPLLFVQMTVFSTLYCFCSCVKDQLPILMCLFLSSLFCSSNVFVYSFINSTLS